MFSKIFKHFFSKSATKDFFLPFKGYNFPRDPASRHWSIIINPFSYDRFVSRDSCPPRTRNQWWWETKSKQFTSQIALNNAVMKSLAFCTTPLSALFAYKWITVIKLLKMTTARWWTRAAVCACTDHLQRGRTRINKSWLIYITFDSVHESNFIWNVLTSCSQDPL